MESSVYRRNQAGQIYGTDELKLKPNEKSQKIETDSKFVQSDKPAQSSNVASDKPIKRTLKSDVQNLKIPKVKVPIKLQNIIPNRENLPTKPIDKVIYFAKRILIFYLVFFIVLGLKTSLSLQKSDATPSVPVEDTAGINWLFVGSDSRVGLTPEEQQQLHTGQDEGAQRTDTIMIVHIGSNGTTLVSLPRDSYVFIPEHIALDGTNQPQIKNKLNAAYSSGGAALLVETVEFNTGLHIDHYMEVGFRGIRDLTDAVGGVDICVPADYDDEKSNLHVKAGCQELDGVTALAYVRMRYADPKGDIGRIERQQQYLGAFFKKVVKVTTVLNPIAMWRMSTAGTDSLILGQGDGIKDLSKLGLAMKSIAAGKGKITTVPIANPDAQTAAGSSVIWDKEAALAFFAELAAN